MRIEMVAAVVDPENDSAQLTYNVDGVTKQIGWGNLNDLFEQWHSGTDKDHTKEQRLLAQIVNDYWIDCDDWWQGAVVEG